MKKTFAFIFIFAIAFTLSGNLVFSASVHKKTLCHITDAVDIPQDKDTLVVGHIIRASFDSIKGHIPHGDFVYADSHQIDSVSDIGTMTWRQLAEDKGLKLAGVECAGLVLDDVIRK